MGVTEDHIKLKTGLQCPYPLIIQAKVFDVLCFTQKRVIYRVTPFPVGPNPAEQCPRVESKRPEQGVF